MNKLFTNEFNLQPTNLQNELVRLSPLDPNDFERLFHVASDPLIWEQHPESSGSAFLIFNNKTGELIGSTRFYDYDREKNSVAIGYTFLSRNHWGGLYNRALKSLMLDYAFSHVDSVIFHVGSTNLRSQQAVLKLGAVKTREIQMAFNTSRQLHFEYEIRKTDWIK
jgi:RimJ/RimL family protein N-acetyltransferase